MINIPDGLAQAQTVEPWPVAIHWNSLGLTIALSAPGGYFDSLLWAALPMYLSFIVPPVRDGRLTIDKQIAPGNRISEYVDGGTYLKLSNGTVLPEPPPVDWTNPEANARWEFGGDFYIRDQNYLED